MYMNENSHRFPALVMAAGLTTAVIIGLSALAHSTVAIAPGARQVISTTVSAISPLGHRHPIPAVFLSWSLPSHGIMIARQTC